MYSVKCLNLHYKMQLTKHVYKILNKWAIILPTLFFSLSAAATEKVYLIAPSCLLKHVPIPYQRLTSTASLDFVETDEINIPAFIEAKQIRQKKPCGGFIDVTESWLSSHQSPAAFIKTYDEQLPLPHINYPIQYQKQVTQLLSQLNPQEMWNDLRVFSNTDATQFPDRAPNSASGVKAAQWLQDKIKILANENQRDDIHIYTVPTPYYRQPSVVIKIGDSTLPGILIGAHMDTLPASKTKGKPGADDDGSGAVTVIGIARTILNSGMHFKKPIYLIWYAAEEVGLKGSQAVVRDFQAKHIPVAAVLQYDMTGFAYKNSPDLWLITDKVNPDLTAFLGNLITTYLKNIKKPAQPTQCGYACSDHASWTRVGIPAAFPFEAKFGEDNPAIHTSGDVIDLLTPSHITDYAALGLAFAVELAEPLE